MLQHDVRVASWYNCAPSHGMLDLAQGMREQRNVTRDLDAIQPKSELQLQVNRDISLNKGNSPNLRRFQEAVRSGRKACAQALHHSGGPGTRVREVEVIWQRA